MMPDDRAFFETPSLPPAPLSKPAAPPAPMPPAMLRTIAAAMVPAAPPEAEAPLPASVVRQAAPRPAPVKRDKFIGFARDEQSANLLHETLGSYVPNTNIVHVVDFRTSLTILAAMASPEIVLIDLSGEEQPINAVLEVADVVEPGTIVLAIGESQNVNFYRTVTKGMGVREYLPKPLARGAVEEHFLPIIANQTASDQPQRGGRLVVVAGTRGGVGATTISTNLAWYISSELHRHTLLIDGELHTGTVALNLDIQPNTALATALEAPERVDQLFIERSTLDAGDRLHVLAGIEELGRDIAYQPEAAVNFIQTLRARYNFALADAGARLEPFARDLLYNAQQRIIVMDPSTISIRNLERLLGLPGGASQNPRVLIVLNRAGAPGGLSQAYMEQTMGMRFDAVIPDLPRIVPRASQLGQPAASLRGAFRAAIAQLAGAIGAGNGLPAGG
ncbi:AAA family ATPase [Acidocella sp.]|uniref:AAA family ATPase n=1 Tax=Acidocella sp. TaxID=50710 RepID=UPI00261AE79C|nr:AAA family ATPase [Acidocella sp.]